MFVDFNILNQLGSPSINSNTFANRPAAGQTGRLFVSTDTFEIYRDNGTTWDLIGGPGSSTITGTGTATQVAYFTSSQAIGSSANLFWDNTNTRLGIGIATPGAALDIHSTGVIAQFNTTSGTGNTYIAFQRTGTGLWRVGDTYNAGNNFFELHNTVLGVDAMEFEAATNKSAFQAQQTYTTGLARGNYFDFNLSVAAGGSFSSPNAITALGASLDLTLAGNATIPSGARSGLDAYNSIAFTGAGTLTHTQGTQIRAYSNLTAGWAFNGSATGTITHLAGLHALFPDNSGSAVNVTNNYALLLNDQTANTGTVTYTNRWGVYQEGASDLNYLNANLLLGSTTNTGNKLQVTGTSYFNGNVGIGTVAASFALDVATANARVRVAPSTTTNYALFQATNAGNTAYLGLDDSLGGLSGTAYALNVYHNGAYPIVFSTSGLQRMTITSAGLVGIGTTTPNANLTVDSSEPRIRMNRAGVNQIIFNHDGTIGTIRTETSTPLVLGTNGTERARITAGGNFLIGTPTDSGYKTDVAGSLRNTTDAYLNTSSGFTAIGTTTSQQLPTITVPSGQGSVICTNGSTIISWQGGVPSPYTQNVQIDIVFQNWGSNNVIGLADIMVTLRQWNNVPGTAFGKVFATNTASAATFSTFNTTDVTTSQCTISAASGGNYTLRITIDPTNTTDRLGVYLNVQNGGIPGISSVTISYV